MSTLLLHRKLLESIIITNSSHNNLANINNDDMPQWFTLTTLVAHVLAYIAVIVVLTIVLLLVINFLGGFDNANYDELSPTETFPLRPEKTEFVAYNYGTITREDVEKGNCSNNINNSSEELYDGKLCVICYDEQRDCFFVPCGHCATCYACAQRIFEGESKSCPVCRRLIGKVRRLFAS